MENFKKELETMRIRLNDQTARASYPTGVDGALPTRSSPYSYGVCPVGPVQPNPVTREVRYPSAHQGPSPLVGTFPGDQRAPLIPQSRDEGAVLGNSTTLKILNEKVALDSHMKYDGGQDSGPSWRSRTRNYVFTKAPDAGPVLELVEAHKPANQA